MRCNCLISLVTLVLASATASAGHRPAPIVPTTVGFFRGVDLGSMRQWRGIPYVKAPTGSRRLAPPVRTGFLGLRDATQFGSKCLQPDFDPVQNLPFIGGSEDCLFLNVTVPADATILSGYPVVVHLHGGGNVGGSGKEDTSAFVENGVIVVTLNYRLGALGWMAHPDLSAEQGGHSGNYAMLDQIAALKWVRDNIWFFGGDPRNVTLGGFSAGAFDAQGLAASPLARGLFKRLASQSASRWAVTNLYNTLDFNEVFGSVGIPEWGVAGIQSDVGCAGAADALDCMRSVPAERYVQDYGQWFPETDGYVLPKTVLETIRDHGGTVPMLIGGNREEDGFIMVDDSLPDPFTDDDYAAFSDNIINYSDNVPDDEATPEGVDLVGQKIRALYPPSDYPSIRWALTIVSTDTDKTCPTRLYALASHAPTYKYLYTHVLETSPDLARLLSFHGSEEMMLWHEPQIFGQDYTRSPAEEQLSRRMSRYWTNFAKRGDPNGPGLPVWPGFEPAHERYLQLDDHITAHSGGYHVAQCEAVVKLLWP